MGYYLADTNLLLRLADTGSRIDPHQFFNTPIE